MGEGAVADFASCALPNAITLQKDLPQGRVNAGDQFQLSIEGQGLSQGNVGVTTGAETGLQDQEPGETAGTNLGLPGKEYTIRETAAPGSSTDLSRYTTRWECVDTMSDYRVEGVGLNGSFVIPENNGNGADLQCKFVNRLKALDTPDLSITKTSDASKNSRVGDTVHYTVTAKNTGTGDYTAANPAVVFDNLSGVLDDADYASDAVASEPGNLSYASPLLAWTGALPVGKEVKLTYSVKLKAGGDRNVRNVAWAPKDPGTKTPPNCDADQTDPTTGEPCAVVEFPVPALKIEKSADKKELPAVGEKVAYTVKVTNQGPGEYTAQAPASFTDDLSKVLDDADYNGDAVASTGTVSYAAPKLSWTGALKKGESATINYTVTYTAKGNKVLLNTACVDESQTTPGAEPCAKVQIPGAALSQWKSVKASADPVVAGTKLEYVLHFRNDGEGAAAVDAIDDLTHVTDDADVVSEPVADTGLSAARSGKRIAITGTVPAGKTLTVKYTVEVKADGSRGDDKAVNFLLKNDPTNPPTTPTDPVCDPADPKEPDCTSTPIVAVKYTKHVKASSDPVVDGTKLTYTITAENTGQATAKIEREDVLSDVLDDTDLTKDPVSDTASVTVSQVQNGRFSIGGTLAAGKKATITYEVTVKEQADRGNNSADNFLVKPGENPEQPCNPASETCTVTPLPKLDVKKSSDPVSGSRVLPGETVNYTLTFTNSGAAASRVDYRDVLTGVLDDADLIGQPIASDPALTAKLNAQNDIVVTGTLAAKQSVTVKYAVKVKVDGKRGDNQLGNFVVPAGELPPLVCEPSSKLCTEHSVPELSQWKSVKAKSTPVVAGTELEYTLFFANDGKVSAPVDAIDDLTHVTDDADVTVEPVADTGLSAVRSGNRIAITGQVPAGKTLTVKYTVKAKADGQRGDDLAANFLLKNDPTNPPTTPTDPVCQPGNAEKPDCTLTPVGALKTWKSVAADTLPVEAGTTLSYTLNFVNNGKGSAKINHTDFLSDVLDDADLVEKPKASGAALTVSDVANKRFTVTGSLAAGQSATVTYQVKVKADGKRGNNSADNFLVPTDPTNPEPPTECVPGDPNCTTTPVPNLSVLKSSDPVSGSTVKAGDTVTYTVTLSNTGKAAGMVDYTDHLANVLDDATLTGAPKSSDPALLVSSGADGKVRITGQLGAGKVVKVTYTVTVKPEGTTGDKQLRNVVAKTENPNPVCGEDGVVCTEHPVGELSAWKTVDPASGSVLKPGQTAEYTLHFENVGKGAVQVSRVDDLNGVLDDAEVTGAPVSSSPSLTVSAIADGRFSITGSLKVGEQATVSYQVRAFDPMKGDKVLVNFLLKPDDKTPGPDDKCEPKPGENPTCTVNPIADVTVVKSSDPKSGTKVRAGERVTYTLSFTNSGAAASAFDYTDHMVDVFDDATLVDGPTSSDSKVHAKLAGDRIRVTGSVAAGATVTVKYTVQVKQTAEQGDHSLGNVVAQTGTAPICVAGSQMCTKHPVVPSDPNHAITGAQSNTALTIGGGLLFAAGLGLILIAKRRRRDASTVHAG